MTVNAKQAKPDESVEKATLYESAVNSSIEELQAKVATQAKTIEVLFAENESLKSENENLSNELSNTLPGMGLDPNGEAGAILTQASNIRLELLKAFIPQIGLDYASHNAQRAEVAVKEVMEAWGLSDDQKTIL